MSYFPKPKRTITTNTPDNPNKTAGKANAASAMTFAMAIAAFWGYGEFPTEVALAEAMTEVGIALVMAGVNWLVTYYKVNYIKKVV